MKSFDLLQEPLEPTASEVRIREFFESRPFIDAWIQSKLCSFDDREDYGVLKPHKNVSYSVQGERILARVHKVLLHFESLLAVEGLCWL